MSDGRNKTNDGSLAIISHQISTLMTGNLYKEYNQASESGKGKLRDSNLEAGSR